MEIKIIKTPEPQKEYLIVDKPSNLPSAPLNSEDKNNVFSMMAEKYPELNLVKGKKEIEHGLLHRLDTITSGLMIIAATDNAYENLMNLQKNNKIIKTYKAVCHRVEVQEVTTEGFPDLDTKLRDNLLAGKEIVVESYFRPFGAGHKEVRPVTKNSNTAALKKIGKPVLYSTRIKLLEKIENKYVIECVITNGYRHQIRSHLAWLGFPIINDPLYDVMGKKTAENSVEFSAIKINIDGDVYTRKET